MGKALGRPTKYAPQLCEMVVGFFEEGLFKTEVCARLRISTKTFNRWCEEHPEFNEAAELGITLVEAYMINKQKNYISGKEECKKDLLQLNLNKNCLGWDKPDTSSKNTINIENMQVNQLPSNEITNRINFITEELKRFGIQGTTIDAED